MQKLYKDILELKTWIREEEGAKAEGKGQFGKIHSEKQLLDLIYKFNKDKKKEINIIWLDGDATVLENDKYKDKKDKYTGDAIGVFRTIVKADFKVIITNGEESIEMVGSGIGEEQNGDVSFGLGKALTYGKRFWLQKFLDLSSDDIDPEHVSNKPVVKTTTKTTTKKTLDEIETNEELATYKNGNPVKDKNGKQLTKQQQIKAVEIFNTTGQKVWDLEIGVDL